MDFVSHHPNILRLKYCFSDGQEIMNFGYKIKNCDRADNDSVKARLLSVFQVSKTDKL